MLIRASSGSGGGGAKVATSAVYDLSSTNVSNPAAITIPGLTKVIAAYIIPTSNGNLTAPQNARFAYINDSGTFVSTLGNANTFGITWINGNTVYAYMASGAYPNAIVYAVGY